ncbi:hypothetical protein [Agathobaculum sp. Marseille-P7918]|uniref:hypothetical protein n=1 Tax=Agathobaculum sp. Marseille-P7918 TaxID=2479843 RepID=UPI000F6391C9|nr:hypothetical protein [Agathobaculum sp. Marseille-P7918]
MKQTKFLPILMIVLCLPGVVVRALHLLNGFDIDTGLPAVGDAWVWYFTALLVLAAVLYAVLSLPLRKRNAVPFEQLLGTQNPLFRMAAVISGLLIVVGGLGYLYLTMTTGEEDAAGWAKILEIVYAVVSVLCGMCAIGLAKAQGGEMTAQSAKLTLVPLLWSCLHLLVNYRMTCVDPKLASFAFGLVADVILVLAFYYLARLLYGKPRPALLAFFSAVTTTMAVSDLGGYGLSRLMGVTTPEWSAKMILRGCLSVAACILLAAELFMLCRDRASDAQE